MTNRQRYQPAQQSGGFALDKDYKQVAERIQDLRNKHPEAVLRPYNPHEPFKVVEIGDKTFIAYTAVCYRSPDDKCPAIATAWEPFPGPTRFTKDSELMNAETSAWGRCIIAALASESKHIASAEEVQNRRDQEHVTEDGEIAPMATDEQSQMIKSIVANLPKESAEAVKKAWKEKLPPLSRGLTTTQVEEAMQLLKPFVEAESKPADQFVKELREAIEAAPVSDAGTLAEAALSIPCTPAMAKDIYAAGARLGFDHDETQTYAKLRVGRSIKSMKDLTVGEANDVLAALEKEEPAQ